MRFLPIQADVASVGNVVTFIPSGILLGLNLKQRITSSWLPEECVNGWIQKVQFVLAVRERSFSIESRRELTVETKYGLLTLALGLDAGDEIACLCVLTATSGRGDFVGKTKLGRASLLGHTGSVDRKQAREICWVFLERLQLSASRECGL